MAQARVRTSSPTLFQSSRWWNMGAHCVPLALLSVEAKRFMYIPTSSGKEEKIKSSWRTMAQVRAEQAPTSFPLVLPDWMWVHTMWSWALNSYQLKLLNTVKKVHSVKIKKISKRQHGPGPSRTSSHFIFKATGNAIWEHTCASGPFLLQTQPM
jgi:hypothetical protein